MSKLRAWAQDSRGAAAVEFALVLPLLMLLVLGGVDWGYYFFVKQVSTNAAREGARAGSLELDETDASDRAFATARAYLQQAGLDPDATGVSVLVDVRDDGTATDPRSTVQVDVSYPAGSLTGFAAVVVPATVTASAQMRRF